MRRIVLGLLPALMQSGSVIAAPAQEYDPLDELRCHPSAKWVKPKESWQGQGKRKKAYQHRGKR